MRFQTIKSNSIVFARCTRRKVLSSIPLPFSPPPTKRAKFQKFLNQKLWTDAGMLSTNPSNVSKDKCELNAFESLYYARARAENHVDWKIEDSTDVQEKVEVEKFRGIPRCGYCRNGSARSIEVMNVIISVIPVSRFEAVSLRVSPGR